MERIRVLLANHHPIIRSSLRLLLEREPRVRVIGEAANEREAIVLSEYLNPDITLLNVKLPHVAGIPAAREISAKGPNPKTIFVSALTDEGYVYEAFKAGARGYVLGDEAQADLVTGVLVVAKGGVFLSPLISSHLIDDCKRRNNLEDCDISDYQRRLFCWLAEGIDEREISRRLDTNAEAVSSDCDKLRNLLQRIGIPDIILNSTGQPAPSGITT
ncbi:MAG: response regulator transcription factor [Acidobacteriota bacterium]|nr:response regulator transcription factor [Acidobacteriota bacterium]